MQSDNFKSILYEKVYMYINYFVFMWNRVVTSSTFIIFSYLKNKCKLRLYVLTNLCYVDF